MREGIQPKYYQATVTCNCGNTFVTGSTKKDIHVEIKSILEYLINRNSTNDFTDKINQQVEKLKYDERCYGRIKKRI